MHVSWFTIWRKYFKVILAVFSSWFLCFILTMAEVFQESETKWGYEARTDVRLFVITDAPWFRVPYPGRNSSILPTWADKADVGQTFLHSSMTQQQSMGAFVVA